MRLFPIELLRCLSIIAVVGFHADMPGFSYGYLGVDLFFLISGFVIGLSPFRYPKTENYLAYFFVRRFFKIMPPLIVVVYLLLTFSFLFVGPLDFVSVASSVPATLLGAGNIYFLQKIGYFGQHGSEYALLHLWSIGVEVQFYCFWMVLILLIRLREPSGLLVLAVFVSVGSILFREFGVESALAMLASDREGATEADAFFYLFPSRLLLFGAGMLGAYVHTTGNRVAGGLTALAISSVFYTLTSDAYPLEAATTTTLCFVSLVVAGPPRNCFSYFPKLLKRLVEFTGKISYSVYICHWPLIWGAKYLAPDWERGAPGLLFLFSFVIGAGVYRIVEMPALAAVSGRTASFFSFSCVMCAVVLLILLSNLIVNSQGFPNRSNMPLELAAVESWQDLHEAIYAGVPPSESYDTVDVILLGDSHAEHLSFGLNRLVSEGTISGWWSPGNLSCFHLVDIYRVRDGEVMDCQAEISMAMEFAERHPQALVIFAHSWVSQLSRAFVRSEDGYRPATDSDLISSLNATRKIFKNPSMVVGQVPTSNGVSLWKHISSTKLRDRLFGSTNVLESPPRDTALALNAILRRASEDVDVDFYDPHEAFCTLGSCRNFLRDGSVVYSDGSHLSKAGSTYLVKSIFGNLILDEGSHPN